MRHIKLRSFPTKCQKCGQPVLYWESVQGAKIFFNLPIYGRPIRHICKTTRIKKNSVLESNKDHLMKKVDRVSFRCPVCDKLFPTEAGLNSHVKNLRNKDDAHADFWNMLDYLNVDEEEPGQNPLEKESFKTSQNLTTLEDRFILKSKNPDDQKKFEKLLRRKRGI